MDFTKDTNIEITALINPHLFWFVPKNDHREKHLNNLNKQLHEAYKANHILNASLDIFTVGEIVAAEINDKLYRAIVEDIYSDTFLLWLIDYGVLRESNNLFKLPTTLRRTHPLSKQASLNNVVYMTQDIEFNNYGQAISVDKCTKHPTPLCREACIRHLVKAQEIKFKFEKTEDGIIFGDLLFRDSENNEKSLKHCLIQENILVFNEKYFDDITDFINSYRENHLMIISKACMEGPYPLKLQNENDKDLNFGINIVSKVLEEFEYIDLLRFEDERSEPLWLMRKSKNDTLTSLDTSASDIETPTKIKSKKELLLEKMRERKKVSGNSLISDETDNSFGENTSVLPKTETDSTSKIKKLCALLRQRKMKKLLEQQQEQKSHQNKADSGKGEEESQKKIIFTAAGAERAYPHILSKNKKGYSRRPNVSLEQGSSSESEVHTNRKTYQNCSSVFKESIHSNEKKCPNSSRPKESITPIKNDIDVKNNSLMEDTDNTSFQVDKDTSEEKDSSSEEHKNFKENSCNYNENVNRLKIKPFCSCSRCKIWTKEENVFIEDFPKERKVDKIISANEQLLLREDENIYSNIHIYSIDYSSVTKIQKRTMKKLLVHSEIILNPVHEISKVAFDRTIEQNLRRMEYREAKRIQVYSWPAILRNQHVVMISDSYSGKTMAYLPAVCTFLAEKHDRYSSLTKVAGGPIIIILCGNTRKCEEVYDLARSLFGNTRANISLVTYPLTHVNTSHTDMLITTPNILLDLLKNKMVNFKRLCHLVLEDGDIILQKCNKGITSVFELAQSMLKNRVFTKAMQLIVCAEHWNSNIKCLVTNLQQVPVVCIGNYLEAALYGGLEFSMKFINSSCKDQELKSILKESHRINRSIIICREEEVEAIHEILTFKGIDNIPITTNMSQDDRWHCENVWTDAVGGQYSVLICSDFMLNADLCITSATTLIHYSLPKSWTKFLKRLSCLLENSNSPLESKKVKITSRNIVLLDENCNEQINRFFSFINATDLKKELPEKLQQFSNTLKCNEEEERLRKEASFCENLKLFGKCTKNQCPKRHLVSADIDVSDKLPKCGKIKFKIVNILDVTSFSIQLFQHVDEESKVHEYEEFMDITEDLTATLRLGRKKIQNPVVGHHYAFYNFDDDDGSYYRCEVVDVDNDCLQIKLLDKGTIISTMTSRLYRLPKEFNCSVKPRAIIDALLANYVPPYDDENFSAKSFFELKTLLESHDYKNVIFSAEVCLQLNHTLWLKDVCEELILTDKIIPGFQLSREMFLSKLVHTDVNQLKNLNKLCTDVGIDIPKFEKPKYSIPVKIEKPKLQWAFLEDDKISEVTFASAFSPEEIYVKQTKFDSLLYNLQKEIQQSVKKPNYPKLKDIQMGDVYLAKDPDGQEYCRVIILKIESDKVLCFSLDFGDELVVLKEEIKFIQPTFITKLPFQCIQCRLHGVKSFSENWEEDATNLLYNYAHETGTDIFRSLYLKVCKKENSPSASGTKYSVILKDGFGEKNVIINQLLIDCGMVTNNNEGIEDFEIPTYQADQLEIDEDLEEVAYICQKTDDLDQHLSSNGNPFASDENVQHNLEEMELYFFGDPFEFYAEITGGKEPTPSSTNTQLPPLTAAPPVDYYTPEVYWSQTEKTIRISIRLIGISDCKLTLTNKRTLKFSADKEEKSYYLKIILYNLVDTMQHTIGGQDVRVTLSKINYIDWPRLLLAKQKARNIHYDVSAIRVEEEFRKLLQLPKELDVDDSDELGEDDPMYVVHSDLDSDLDMDLPEDSD